MKRTTTRSLQWTERQHRLVAGLARHRPRDAAALRRFVDRVLGVKVPDRPLIEGHQAPMDYLAHAFFDGGDVVVWANRGGGKTFLGAVATLLDLVFKPGIRVCILGGSFEQSSRMYSHLRRLLDRPRLRALLAFPPTQRRVALVNGSRVRVLCQSERSVRGMRVQRLRCDEAEMFEPDVWEAAQYVTRSAKCGGVEVRGGVEAISTMHAPFGLMSKLVDRPGMKVIRWGALDVAERCDESVRSCEGCVLWEDCGGRAREASGFIPIQDLIDQWHRNDRDRWAAEMMCRRPSVRNLVYPSPPPSEGSQAVSGSAKTLLIAGMDFGLRNPLAMVWAEVHCNGDDPQRWPVEVIDVYAASGLVLDEHLDRIEARGHARPTWIGIDPAGHARSLQTGRSDAQALQRRGYRVRSKAGTIQAGIAIVRRRLDRGTLRIRPRCTALLDALRRYHYDPARPDRETPVKDGPDHLCDALRYMLTCLDAASPRVEGRTY